MLAHCDSAYIYDLDRFFGGVLLPSEKFVSDLLQQHFEVDIRWLFPLTYIVSQYGVIVGDSDTERLFLVQLKGT